jgi:hypothetical protein
MEDIERRVWWEVRAMTRREVITDAIIIMDSSAGLAAADIIWIRRGRCAGFAARSSAAGCRR